MKLFSRKNSKETISLIFLLESGAVHAGIVLTAPQTTPRLLYETTRAYTSATKDTKMRLTRMHKALAHACEDITAHGLPHIVAKKRKLSKGFFDTIRFVYSAPWYVSKGRRVVLEHNEATTFSAAMLKKLVDEQGSAIIPSENGSVETIEQYATGWAVDGYAIDDPVGKTGKRLSLNLFASALPTAIRTSTEETCMRFFHGETTHHSLAFVASRTLAHRSNGAPFVFIHISQAITECALFSHNALLDTGTMPYGSDHIHDAWSTVSKRPAHEASFRIPTQQGGLTIDDSWKQGLTEVLSDMNTGHTLPETVFLSAENTIREATAQTIRDVYTEVFRRKTQVEMLSVGSFGSLVSAQKKNMSTGAPPALCLIALHEGIEA